MRATLARLVLCSALYGFSIGSVHSSKFAARNLAKFPLLLLGTAAVCALAYFVIARAFTRRLSFARIQRLVLETFGDLSVLLASMAPALLFLALTIEQPTLEHLGEYPLFLGSNVVTIAVCGTVALLRQTRKLLRDAALPRAHSLGLSLAWLLVSLLVGSQGAWFLRPFCGVSTIDAPFMLGSAPDYQGATDFFQATYHLIDPPPVSDGYQRFLRSSSASF